MNYISVYISCDCSRASRRSYDRPSSSSRRKKRRRRGCVCVRRKRVVELVINGCERLSRNQAEIRPQVVPPEFSGGANSLTQ